MNPNAYSLTSTPLPHWIVVSDRPTIAHYSKIQNELHYRFALPIHPLRTKAPFHSLEHFADPLVDGLLRPAYVQQPTPHRKSLLENTLTLAHISGSLRLIELPREHLPDLVQLYI